MKTTRPAHLILENGKIFSGFSLSSQVTPTFGEVVFTTGMTGYCESLTDPSYRGQIVVFTYPLIGNYGIPPKELWESERIQVAGVVISEACLYWSHSQSIQSFLDWLERDHIPLLFGIDTRSLTKTLRDAGVMLGVISLEKTPPQSFYDPNKTSLISQVSVSEKSLEKKAGKRVIAVDCGMKANILRSLKKLPLTIERVPYGYDYSSEDFDGVFLSNGPGDPEMCGATIEILKKAMKKEKPIFGICLGAQLLILAAGGKTYKLRYGHRGHNQPCIETATQKCYMTSQNHGYAIEEHSLPKGWRVSFRNLNDNSVEGVEHSSLPFFAVQFHPEAAPGPTDTEWLFEKFYTYL